MNLAFTIFDLMCIAIEYVIGLMFSVDDLIKPQNLHIYRDSS